MEPMYSSETSVDFQRTTRRYIPEDSTLQRNSFFSYQIQTESEAYVVSYLVGTAVICSGREWPKRELRRG
jgi:hypothetical protein